MRLVLIRHAKAADREDFIGADIDRPLTKKGKKQARKIAKFIAKKYPNATEIIASQALRSCDSAKEILSSLGANASLNIKPSINPDTAQNGLFELVEEVGTDSECVIIVGHEPRISEFLAHFGNGKIKVGKGAIIELEKDGSFWELVGLRNFEKK